MTIEQIYHIISLLWLCLLAEKWSSRDALNIAMKFSAIASAGMGAVVVALDILR